LGIRTDDPVIGLVARYHQMKDHITFLQASAKFSSDHPGAYFVLCGTNCDGQNDVLNRLISQLGLSDRVILLGCREDLEFIYPAFDLATLCSAFGEGFPNVLTEAMACGVPCVATDVGACREIIDGQGLIVPPRAPAALAEAWESVLAGPTELLAKRVRARACEHYGIDQICKLYEKTYLEIARAG
jgi:glycosyltransferase involved in cell wall biosynthesis